MVHLVRYADDFIITGRSQEQLEHEVLLFRAARMSIERHTKVKGAANPFDPEWETYFERRRGVKMATTLKGRRQLLRPWKAQEGICPVCKDKITALTGWHNHHIVWRARLAGQ